MRRWKLILGLGFLGLMGAVQAEETDGAMTLNAKTRIVINNNPYEARISAAFKASAEGLKAGILQASQFNLVIFDVPQSQITGSKPVGRESGTLGFALNGEPARLQYDPISQTLEGELSGSVNIPGYIDPKPTPIDRAHKDEAHVFGAPTQPGRLKLTIKLERELQNLIGVKEVTSFGGEITLNLAVDALKEPRIARYEVALKPTPVVVDFGWWFYEIAQNLCVQPVRILTLKYIPWPPYLQAHYSGDGLPFGQPGAITQWKKADLTLHWNTWQTVLDPTLGVFSSSEAASLLATVDDPACVEVFFVDEFSPYVFWGGGATFASGTADAQIISTDQNADYGVDLTHLAHELGHAVSLCHPNDPYCEARPEMNPASTGTLMCPSGFNNDNPAVNSVENENNVNNPLLTLVLKPLSAGPDCNGDADCGPCP